MSLLKVYEFSLLAVLCLIVLHAPLSVLIGHILPDYALLAKAWKEIVLSLLSLLAIVLITRKKAWPTVLTSPFVWLAVGFIMIHFLLAIVFWGDIRAIVAGLMIDLRFIIMFLLMYILILFNPDAIKRAMKIILVGGLVVVGFGLLQITVLPDNVLSFMGYSHSTVAPYTTIDRNPDFVRINSTLRGPNPLGALMVVYLGLLLAYLLALKKDLEHSRVWMVIASMASTVAVLFATYSRSAYLAAVAILVATPVLFGKVSKKVLGIGVAMLAIVVLAGLFISQTDWFSNVILHEDPESNVVAKSNEGHVTSLFDGLHRVGTQPFGAGIGSTGSASLYDKNTSNNTIIENTYLFIAHESGWLGLLVFLALFSTTVVTLWRHRAKSWLNVAVLTSGVGLALIGLLLPVWVDDTVSIIWWALAGMALASVSGIIGEGNAKRTRKQKTTRATELR